MKRNLRYTCCCRCMHRYRSIALKLASGDGRLWLKFGDVSPFMPPLLVANLHKHLEAILYFKLRRDPLSPVWRRATAIIIVCSLADLLYLPLALANDSVVTLSGVTLSCGEPCKGADVVRCASGAIYLLPSSSLVWMAVSWTLHHGSLRLFRALWRGWSNCN
eukprot:5640777-Pleurochrysis_carterae.AAC.1